ITDHTTLAVISPRDAHGTTLRVWFRPSWLRRPRAATGSRDPSRPGVVSATHGWISGRLRQPTHTLTRPPGRPHNTGRRSFCVVQRARNDHRTVTPRRQPERTGAMPARHGGNAVRRGPTPSTGSHALLRPARIALVVVAALVLGVTGFGWATMHGLVSGLTTADVIDSDAGGSAPADGSTDILLVGMDSRTDAKGNPLPQDLLRKLDAGAKGEPLNTDTMILLHVPNDTSEAVAI